MQTSGNRAERSDEGFLRPLAPVSGTGERVPPFGPGSSYQGSRVRKRSHHPRLYVAMAALAVLGPGLMVMLADTDAGSVVTAAQSGAGWRYALLPVEVALVPVLYLVMELTARLGITTGKGHARLVKECFGNRWAVVSLVSLLVSTTGALVTELAGVAGVAAMYGVPPALSVPAAACFLGLVVLSGSYRRVERIGLTLGMFELAFVFAALRAHPHLQPLAASFLSSGALGRPGYLSIVAANVGAVIMPWMIFYQQAAVVDKGLEARHLPVARADTAVGAVVTQLVMIAVLVAAGATLYTGHKGSGPVGGLVSVQAISAALVPFLGPVAGRLAFGVGMMGAALVAAIVVSLAAAWGFSEVCGTRGSLNAGAKQAPAFYGSYFASLVVAACLTMACGSFVKLSLAVEIGNSLLLPLVLGFLLALARKALPIGYRLGRGRSLATLAVVIAVLVLNIGVAAKAVGL